VENQPKRDGSCDGFDGFDGTPDDGAWAAVNAGSPAIRSALVVTAQDGRPAS